MTGQEGAPHFAGTESVTGDVTAGKRLAAQARRLGQQHRSAAIAPFGDVEHVYCDEGSARLPGVPGVTSSHHGGQRTRTAAPGRRLLRCARGPRGRGRRSRLMTASISSGIFVMSLMTAEGGGSHSG
jgi:hypothetical protein